MWQQLAGRIASLVTRAKVQGSVVAGRTVLQVVGLDGEVFENVELLLPPGYVARPLPGADVLLAQVNGTRDHKVLLGGDSTADAQNDLKPGEFGIARGGVDRIILRSDRIEIASADLPVSITSANAGVTLMGGTTITIAGMQSVTLASQSAIALDAPAVTVNGRPVQTQ